MAEARVGVARRTLIGSVVVLAIISAAIIPFVPVMVREFASIRPHAPDWALWVRLPITVQVHVIAALTALGVGTIILFRRKGTGFHKTLGWTWVIAMGTTAVSSLFITGLNGNFYSFIHLISGWTIIALPMAIYAIRSRKVETHRRAMTGMFVGGLIIAGALAFLPGRFMFEFFLG